MEYIASGAQADVYKEGSKAIKLFKDYVQKENIEYEVNLQKMAFDYGLPVPEIFDITEINGKFGRVMEYIEGVPLGSIIMENNSKFEEYLVKSIEIQSSIHKVETDKFPLMKDIQKNYILGTNKLTQTDKEKLLNKMEKSTYENKLCHGDFHILNLIQTSNDIKIIDWVNANSGTPNADICRTYLLYKIHMENIADIYLETYCNIKKVDKLEVLSWLSIIAGARLGEYVKDENAENILKEIIKNNI
jgi:aminoglycoside phosphotransferase (APT) family kinase protein